MYALFTYYTYGIVRYHTIRHCESQVRHVCGLMETHGLSGQPLGHEVYICSGVVRRAQGSGVCHDRASGLVLVPS